MTLNELISHPFFITSFMALVTILITLYTVMQNKKNRPVTEDQLEKKVDKEDCSPAMRRIGAQIDEIKEVQKQLAKTQSKTEKSLIWIVQKMGGDPVQMGLM